jgi:hypothetical protein
VDSVWGSLYKRQLDFAHAQLSDQKPLWKILWTIIIDFLHDTKSIKSSIFFKLKSRPMAEYNVSGAFAEILNGKYDF